MTIGDDRELFALATAKEAGGDKPLANDGDQQEQNAETQVETPAAEATGTRERDEKGRFKGKETAGQTAGTETIEAQADPAKIEGEEKRADHRIPLAEHLSVRERAQNAERERDQIRQQNETLQRQFAVLQRQIEDLRQPQKEAPDIWANPDGFLDAKLKPIREAPEQMLERISRAIAVDKFGAEAVNSAMQELERQMMTNPQQARFEHQRIMSSDLPYVELVSWHKRQNAMKEIGDDPSAYRQRLAEELRKDPEFVKSVIEAARGQAQQPANGQSRSPNVQLPPSLTRTPGGGGNFARGMAEDDAALFAGFATRR